MSEQESNTAKGANIRLTVLLGLLGIAIAALFYDWKVAQPAAKAGYDKVMKMSDATNAQAGGVMMTNVDVQQALGKKPSKTETADGKTFEYFRWWGGLPGKSYDVIAEYGPGPDNSLLLSAVYLGEIPPPVETLLSVDAAAGENPAASMGGGPGGPGGGGARPDGGETAPPEAGQTPAGDPAEDNAGASATPPEAEAREGEAKNSDQENKAAEKPQKPTEQPPQDVKPPQTKPDEKPEQAGQNDAGDKSEAVDSADSQE